MNYQVVETTIWDASYDDQGHLVAHSIRENSIESITNTDTGEALNPADIEVDFE